MLRLRESILDRQRACCVTVTETLATSFEVTQRPNVSSALLVKPETRFQSISSKEVNDFESYTAHLDLAWRINKYLDTRTQLGYSNSVATELRDSHLSSVRRLV